MDRDRGLILSAVFWGFPDLFFTPTGFEHAIRVVLWYSTSVFEVMVGGGVIKQIQRVDIILKLLFNLV